MTSGIAKPAAALALIIALLAYAGASTRAAGPPPASAQAQLVVRGRYLVGFACNDCHTAGWRESDGKLPVSAWMTGTAIGFRGPWGTVYPANVRLRFSQITERQWLDMVHTRGGRPPMAWHDLRIIEQHDLRAMYAFVRSLGPAGVPAPLSVPHEREPSTPYYMLVTPAPGSK